MSGLENGNVNDMFAGTRLNGPLMTMLVVASLVLAAGGGYAVGRRSGSSGVAAQETQSLATLAVDLGGSAQNRPAPTGALREFELVTKPGQAELVSGVTVEAMTYNGQVPGPTIRVAEGDTLRVTLRNGLDQATSIHWHGLHVPNEMDGVAGVTQDAVEPGETFVYEFVVSHAGTFMYHSHENAVEQIDAGLYGTLIVDPQPVEGRTPTVFDAEYTMLLSAWNVPDGTALVEAQAEMAPSPTVDDMAGMDMGEAASPTPDEMAGMDMGGDAAPTATLDEMAGMDTSGGDASGEDAGGGMAMAMDYNYFTINGKAFPDVPAWTATEGQLVRVRIINISNLVHPMHLHGMDFKVVAKDGEALPAGQQMVMNTLSVNAGETYDIVILADNPGSWVFHCHDLHHTENDGVEPGGLMQLLEVGPAS